MTLICKKVLISSILACAWLDNNNSNNRICIAP